MSFSFGFSGDDVDDEMNDGSGDLVQDQTAAEAANGSAQKGKVEGLPAREHSLDELVCFIFSLFSLVCLVPGVFAGCCMVFFRADCDGGCLVFSCWIDGSTRTRPCWRCDI